MTNVIDLRTRLLKPGGLILPSGFDLYCEPIQAKDEYRVPFIWELNIHGYNYASLERFRPQEPFYYHLRSTDRSLVDYFLSEPEPALSIDLQTLDTADLPKEIRFSRQVTRAGRLDGYVVYFRARADQTLSLTTDPLDPTRAQHWGFRILRTDREEFAVGDTIEIRLNVDKWPDLESWRWTHVKRSASDAPFAAAV
jgi:protein arginine N-methyltransferase 1